MFEIVVLPNGDVVLQRLSDDDKVLVTISFSEEVKESLGDAQLAVAKAMIDAGIDAVQDMDVSSQQEHREVNDTNKSGKVLH